MGHDRTPDEDYHGRPVQIRFNFVEVLAPPRGFEPLAGPVLWAL